MYYQSIHKKSETDQTSTQTSVSSVYLLYNNFGIDQLGVVKRIDNENSSTLPKLIANTSYVYENDIIAEPVVSIVQLLKEITGVLEVRTVTVYNDRYIVLNTGSMMIYYDSIKDPVETGRTMRLLLSQIDNDADTIKSIDFRFDKPIVAFK